MTSKEKFLALVTRKDNQVVEKINYLINNRSLIDVTSHIALKVLVKLEELKMTKEDLAKKMNLPIEEISKIVKGINDIPLSYIVKLQEILNLELLAIKKYQYSSSVNLHDLFAKKQVITDVHYLDYINQLPKLSNLTTEINFSQELSKKHNFTIQL